MRDFNQKSMQRTDLADEKEEYLREQSGKNIPGIHVKNTNIDGFNVNIMDVTDKDGERATGKLQGRYVTVDIGRIWLSDKQSFCRACNVLANFIREFIPSGNGACLLAALGNKNIIADASGPFTAENFIVTRHIKQENPEMFKELDMRETVCICPGVLGSTGLEAAQIIKGAIKEAKPEFIIAVDALASRRLSRLAATVQICNTGISPGSGINNARKELSESTLGVPVIAIGIPTVVEVTTLASYIIWSVAEKSGEEKIKKAVNEIVRELNADEAQGFFVTPKETDHIIKDTSKLIGYARNLALHKSISFEEIDEFLS